MIKRSELPAIYLASKSPRRKEILADLGISFQLIDSPYIEKEGDYEDLSPLDAASKMASLKAFHSAQLVSEGLIIGADTMVVLGNKILGKPKDKDDAREMLGMLSGKPHLVITGISILDTRGLRTVSRSEVTKVFFRQLSEREIRLYLNTQEPYDKAGAYGIQGFGSIFISRIEGCYYNVVGFPIVVFAELLENLELGIIDFIMAGRKKPKG